jgi:hypothetical protein
MIMRVFSSYKQDGFFWFRILGRGISGKRMKTYPLLFSERNGYAKTIKIFGWSFKILNKL